MALYKSPEILPSGAEVEYTQNSRESYIHWTSESGLRLKPSIQVSYIMEHESPLLVQPEPRRNSDPSSGGHVSGGDTAMR